MASSFCMPDEAAFIDELGRGLKVDKASLSFAAYADEWKSERRLSGSISKRTMRKTSYRIDTMLPYIGGMRIGDIDSDTVARLMVRLRTEGGKKGLGLSGTTTRGVFVTLNQMLEEAAARDFILRNPCKKVKPPKLDTEEKEALPVKEARRLARLLTEGQQDANRIGALLALSCGLRREEICGLLWKDLDAGRPIHQGGPGSHG